MVDQICTYLFQKRGIFYYSRRVPKELQPKVGRQRIIVSLKTKNPDDENCDGIINYSYLYSEERLEALRLANAQVETWLSQSATAKRWSKKGEPSSQCFSKLSQSELDLFTSLEDFNSWLDETK